MSTQQLQQVLVDTKWVLDNLKNPKVRIVEVDYDPSTAYNAWHIPGAVLIRWREDLRHPEIRDFIGPDQFAELMARKGISNDTTVVLYGDYNNWFAVYAFWLFKAYGHQDVRILNGGRTKWAKEKLPTETGPEPQYPRGNYKVTKVDWGSHRAFFWEIYQKVIKGEVGKSVMLVDVRSPKEYTGEIRAPPEYADEQTQVGGHIPGAISFPWSTAVNPDTGEFKSPEELRQIFEKAGVTPDKEIITYCRIGERAAHTWFVLKYLLGYPAVRVYDGSWAEWGNLVGVPVKKGDKP
ncbi:MAG: sulfurtransferase [Sulfolobaceae archaeon]